MEFMEFPKMARLSRECIVTEKIDGTNAQVVIEQAENISDWSGSAATPWLKRVETEHGVFGIAAGSRSRYLTVHADNFGWANWVLAHAEELVRLGVGRHFGEWWGSGIQRGYGLPKGEKRFSLFNALRWCAADAEPQPITGGMDPRVARVQERVPSCCRVVPVLYRGEFSTAPVGTALERLRTLGSVAAPGFMQPEGVVVFHLAGNVGFKKTLERDEEPKSRRSAA